MGGYIQAFRAAAAEFSLAAEPDLNAILRMPGALDTEPLPADGALEASVLEKVEELLDRLNQMREEEGRGMERELRQRMALVEQAAKGVEKHRQAVLQTYVGKLKARMQELIGSQIEPERLLQEAALLVDRSDIQEELVRLDTHVKHFLGLLEQGGEAGKKLDFLVAGDEPRGQYIAFEDFGPGGRGAEHYRDGTGDEDRNRKGAGTGAEHRMSGVYIISAPSGSGKSTLVNKVREIVPGLKFSISYTTRASRGDEQNGREYYFVSKSEFEEMVRKDEFLEHANVFGNYYGTARRFLREAEQEGKDLLLDIDVQGAAQIKRKLPDAVSIFILPPNRQELEKRLRTRSLDAEQVIQRRLVTATREIENYEKYDYILVNDRLEESVDALKSILLAERLQLSGTQMPKQTSTADAELIAKAERCRLENVRERLQPILASFAQAASGR